MTTNSTKSSYVVPIASGVLTGVAWGFIFEKTKVYLPITIIDQFKFTNFLMVKMFFAATGGSLIAFAVLESIGRKRSANPMVSIGKNVVAGNILGGFVLGAGMAIGGACPGTAYAQMGVGLQSAVFAMFGGLCGAVLFSYVHPLLQCRVTNYLQQGDRKTLDNVTGINYAVLLPAMGTAMIAGSIALEALFPWHEGVQHLVRDSSRLPSGLLPYSLSDPAWAPQAGVLIGVLQLVSGLIMRESLGASSSYCTMASLCTDVIDSNRRQNAPYLDRFGFSVLPRNSWALMMGLGVGIGAYLSMSWSGAAGVDLVHMPPISMFRAYVGGLLAVYGARTAGGCPSGHGLSGMGKASLSSFVTVAAMFAGGIAAALLFD